MSWTMLAAAAAPAVANFTLNRLSSPRGPSAYEKKLGQLADYLGEQASQPFLQTSQGRSGMRMLDEADERSRKRTTSQGIRTGQSDEARLAGVDSANRAYASGVNRLVQGADRHQEAMMSRQVNMLGAGEGARQGREAQWQRQIQGIVQGLGGAAQGYTNYRMLSQILRG